MHNLLIFLVIIVIVLLVTALFASQERNKRLNLSVRGVRGRRSGMTVIDRPGIEFVDVEKVLLSIAPRDADGRIVHGEFMWEIVDQLPEEGETGDVLTLEPGDTQLSVWAISGAPGTCVVTVTDAEADIMERMPVMIKYGQPAALNLSAGTPVPETPVTP